MRKQCMAKGATVINTGMGVYSLFEKRMKGCEVMRHIKQIFNGEESLVSAAGDRIARIRAMEAIFDHAQRLLDAAEENPSELVDFQPEIARLAEYYEGPLWREDFEADEAGMLPADLKRGVLSEDGIYDLLERNKEVLQGSQRPDAF